MSARLTRIVFAFGLPVEELHHHRFQEALVHLPVSHDDARLRDQFLQPGGHPLHRLDAVVDKKGLPAPAHLANDRLPHGPLAEVEHLGTDGQAAGRRRFDHRQVADAGHRHLEGSGNGRRGEREDIHLCPELLEALLVADPEPLLLIDDDQPQVPELHVLLQQAVRADHHVQCAGGQVPKRGLDLSGRLKAGQQPHAGRERAEALRDAPHCQRIINHHHDLLGAQALHRSRRVVRERSDHLAKIIGADANVAVGNHQYLVARFTGH